MDAKERRALVRRFLRAGKQLGYPPLVNNRGQGVLDEGEEEWLFYANHYSPEHLQAVIDAAERVS